MLSGMATSPVPGEGFAPRHLQVLKINHFLQRQGVLQETFTDPIEFAKHFAEQIRTELGGQS